MAAVCVIGAGVSGLTTALELAEGGHKVTVFYECKPEETTSSTAAAFWYPFWTGDTPDHSWYRRSWAWKSYRSFERFIQIQDSGVTENQLIEYFDERMSGSEVKEVLESMWWRVLHATQFEVLPKSEVEKIVFGEGAYSRRFRSGIKFRTFVINMASYLPFLWRRLASIHVERLQEKIVAQKLQQLCVKYEFIVNCSALGAEELVGDSVIRPKEGVVVRIPRPEGMEEIILMHTGPFFSQFPVYIVPRGGSMPDTVLGGTIRKVPGRPRHIPWALLNQESKRIQNLVRLVRQGCYGIEPGIRNIEPLGVSVGYRPARTPGPGVRLEVETKGSLAGRLIHNYGHEGGGVTLSWGCAHHVSSWIGWLL